jgi:hypothetical protein
MYLLGIGRNNPNSIFRLTMEEKHKLYKGLERPLIFKSFKGKYIYWAAGSLAASVFGAGIMSSVINSFVGIITLVAISIPLLLYTVAQQKKGLYRKKKDTGHFIIQQKFRFKNER